MDIRQHIRALATAVARASAPSSSDVRVVAELIFLSLGLAAIMVGTAQAQDPNLQSQAGTPHTITYKDDSGKDVVVPDLTGNWEAYYWSGYEVVNIRQEKNNFIGFKTKGNSYVGRNEETIKGYIKDGNVYCQVKDSDKGWLPVAVQKIDPSGNSFRCEDYDGRTLKYDRKLK